MHPDQITGDIIELSIGIHRELGPGLLESVYEAILQYELQKNGYRVRRQQPIRFRYDGIVFDEAFRADLIVEDTVIVEVKSVSKLDPSGPRQLLTYARLLDLPVGLVLNFGQITMLSGVKRVVNKLPPFQASRVRLNRTHQKDPTPPRPNHRATPDPPASPRPRENTFNQPSTNTEQKATARHQAPRLDT